MRALWVVDSMKNALAEAQMDSFVRAVDPDVLRLDLLALRAQVEPALGAEIEARGGFVFLANALSRSDVGAFFRAYRWIRNGDYDLIHSHLSWSSLWSAAAGRLAGVPVVATLYGPRANGSGRSEAKDEARVRWALRRWASRVVALSGAQWDQYIREGAFARAFLDVVYQGVLAEQQLKRPEEETASEAWFREKTGFPLGVQVAVTIADLDDWESGVDVLLWAIPKVVSANPQARFVIVGDGEHRGELERRVRARGLNKFVSWMGRDTDVDRVLAVGNLFVHPSLRDPFPVPVLKAMAAGLPVVGTRVGGVPEIIGTSDAGRLVPRSDADALADAVVELLRDPPALSVMGRAAHLRASNMFTVTGWVDRMVRTYRSVLEEARSDLAPRARTYARLDVELLRRGGRDSVGVSSEPTTRAESLAVPQAALSASST